MLSGHRARRPPARARHRRRRRTSRASGRTSTTTRRYRWSGTPRTPPTSSSSTTLSNFAAGQGDRHAVRCPATSARAGAFWRTRDDLEAPDLQVHVAPSRLLGQRAARADDPQGHRRPDAGQRRQPRPAPAALGRPALAPGHRPGLLRRPGRPRRRWSPASAGLLEIVSTGPLRPPPRRPVPARRLGHDPTDEEIVDPRARRTPRRSTTRSAPARWAAASAPSSTPSCACAASTACASPTPP